MRLRRCLYFYAASILSQRRIRQDQLPLMFSWSKTMLERIVPSDIMQPFNNAYSHGVVIPPGARVLHISGQIGARTDGSVPDDGDEQVEWVWKNVLATVKAARMEVIDIVKLTAFIVDKSLYPTYAELRKKTFAGFELPASTAICVPQLLLPEWKIEVEVIAARVE
jgi:2-iminobutanoate/2-iminopropanoate deaminase